MPIYEYKCKSCSKEFSIYFSSYDAGEITCPNCGSKEIKKCISSITHIKKGDGGEEMGSSSSSSCSSCSSNNCSSCGL